MDYPVIDGVICLSPTNRTLIAGVNRPLRQGDMLKFSWWGLSETVRQNAFASLKTWADANNAWLSVMQSENDGRMVLPYLFTIFDRAHTVPNERAPEWTPTQADCWECNRSVVYPSTHCHYCGSGQNCNSCRQISQTDPMSYNENDGVLFCSECSVTCSGCNTSFSNRAYACPNCESSCRCYGCGNYFPNEDGEWTDDPNNGDEMFFCPECYARTCNNCNATLDDPSFLNEDGFCQNCATRSIGEDDDMEAESSLTIPSIPGRENVLLCGVEIEGSNGRGTTRTGNELARNLQNAGLSYHAEMTGYHSGSGHRNYKVHVERDGSVDWEMVVGPINIAESRDVDILDRAVKTVRGMIREGNARLDMRAGLHIHVEAARVGLVGAYNLYRYYMHTEDFLYRVGAAKWPFHRAILGGRGHPEKNPEAIGKLQFARTFTGNRYYGLSFDNYFARYFTQCQCGARMYGMFEDCTCDLGKCTFEFRLFNTTANTTKVHAYLALCQALVAKASSMPEVSADDYPSFDFYRGKVKEFSPTRLRTYKRKWEKCVEFINNELPLTDEERRSIYYCVANSEIGNVVENSGILLERKEN